MSGSDYMKSFGHVVKNAPTKWIIPFVVLVLIFGVSGNASGTVFFYYDAEDSLCDTQLSYPPFNTPNPRVGHTVCGSTPDGSKFIEWITEEGWVDHYTEIHGEQEFPVNCTMGETYYLAYYMRFDRIGGIDIWHEGRCVQSADKGVEMVGNGVRWIVQRGQWSSCDDTFTACPQENEDHRYSIWAANPTHRLNGNNRLEYCPNNNGRDCETNMPQLEYEKWYSVVMGVKMAADDTGSISTWLNGEHVIEHANIKTSLDINPTITDIKVGGTMSQPAYDAPPHYRKFDAILLTDDWQDVVDGGYLTYSDGAPASGTADVVQVGDTIYVYGDGWADLTYIEEHVANASALTHIGTVFTAGANICVNGTGTELFINDSDCTHLRLGHAGGHARNLHVHGQLVVDNSEITAYLYGGTITPGSGTVTVSSVNAWVETTGSESYNITVNSTNPAETCVFAANVTTVGDYGCYVDGVWSKNVAAVGGVVSWNYTGGFSEHDLEISWNSSSTSVLLIAIVEGAPGNSIVTTETMANGTFGAATLTGGITDSSDWAGDDVPTGVDVWSENASLLLLVVLVSLLGLAILIIRGLQ